MRISANEMVDAIVTTCTRLGDDGRGKDELDGYMSMLASSDPRRFGILLGRTLCSKMNAQGRSDDGHPAFYTREEAKAELRVLNIPERVLDYLPTVDLWDMTRQQRSGAQPNGTRRITEAVVNAAERHGSDGRGKDGFQGYLLFLERMDPPTFDTLMRMALRYQLKHPSRPPEPEPDPLMQDWYSAILKKCSGEFWGRETRHIGANPYLDPEADDKESIDATPHNPEASR